MKSNVPVGVGQALLALVLVVAGGMKVFLPLELRQLRTAATVLT
jgi:hypothetical protein